MHLSVGERWGILGVCLRRRDTPDLLRPHNFNYHLLTLSPDSGGHRLELIDSFTEVVYAPEHPQKIIDQLAHPNVKLVTLTITEPAYREDNEDFQFDLQNPIRLTSAIGYLVAGFSLRQQQQSGSLTVISCDNLPENSSVLKARVLAMAAKHYPDLVAWIEENIYFRDSMVDRIVPKEVQSYESEVASDFKVIPQALVVAEDYLQWVIEKGDEAIPELDCLAQIEGVRLVEDVSPYVDMKLQVFNACHSVTGYFGEALSIELLYKVIELPEIKEFLQKMMREEVLRNLLVDKEVASEYLEKTLSRIANPNIKYTSKQVCTNHEEKLRIRLFPSIQAQLVQGNSVDHLSFAVVMWAVYVKKVRKLEEMPFVFSAHFISAMRDCLDAVRDMDLSCLSPNSPSVEKLDVGRDFALFTVPKPPRVPKPKQSVLPSSDSSGVRFAGK